MRRFLTILALLAGCQHAEMQEDFDGPDGSIVHEVHCNGNVNNITACYKEASAFCGGAYEVVDKDSETSVSGHGKYLHSRTRRTLVFRCSSEELANGP